MILENKLNDDMDNIIEYISINNNQSSKTFHFFENNANDSIRNSIKKIRNSERIINCLKNEYNNYKIEHVINMNEIYSSKLRGIGSDAGSDAVFQVNHIDGPFGFIPYLTLIRCIVVLKNDSKIVTNIKDKDLYCKKGDFFLLIIIVIYILYMDSN